MFTNEASSLNANFKAYLLIGSPEVWSEILIERLSGWLAIDNPRQSPDLWWQRYESFGIKDSHELIERESRRSLGGRGRFFVLEIFSATPEAQNALLKTFEEPASDSHFFLIAPSSEIFLPTLLSRLIILDVSRFGSTAIAGEMAESFLALDAVDRVNFVKEKLLKPKDKVVKKSDLMNFVVGLELYLRRRLSLDPLSSQIAQALLELEQARRYLTDPRSGNRLVLEHLALSLPKIS